MRKVIAIFIGGIYFAASSVLPVYAELETPRKESSLEETTERLLIVPLQEEGRLPIPIPFYKKPSFWTTAIVLAVGAVWCSKKCNQDSDFNVVPE